MVERSFLPGFDDLVIPAFFDIGDAAALERWKCRHPDWFVAGEWTPDRRAGSRSSIEERDGFAPTGRAASESPRWADWSASGLLEPESLSLADFKTVAAVARADRDATSPFILAQSRGPVRAVGPFTGPPRSPVEEIREHRFYQALRTLQKLEPENARAASLRDPNRTPDEETVAELEREVLAAVARSNARVRPEGPGEPDPATPLQRRDLRDELVRQRVMDKDSAEAAHHIVPGGEKRSGGRDPGDAQAVLKRFNVDLDGAANGIPLSQAFHNRLHTGAYYRYVNESMRRMRSASEVVGFLRQFGRRLQREDLRYQREGTMPSWTE